MTENLRRINVTFPIKLLAELRNYVPRQERNRFIIEAVEKELHRVRLHQALDESAGVWLDEDHPDLVTVEDVNRYVRQLREAAVPYSWDDIPKETQQDG
jgi:hypothetical protein